MPSVKISRTTLDSIANGGTSPPSSLRAKKPTPIKGNGLLPLPSYADLPTSKEQAIKDSASTGDVVQDTLTGRSSSEKDFNPGYNWTAKYRSKLPLPEPITEMAGPLIQPEVRIAGVGGPSRVANTLRVLWSFIQRGNARAFAREVKDSGIASDMVSAAQKSSFPEWSARFGRYIDPVTGRVMPFNRPLGSVPGVNEAFPPH